MLIKGLTFYLGLTLLCIVLISILFGNYIPLELSDLEYSSQYYFITAGLLPLSLILLVFKPTNPTKQFKRRILWLTLLSIPIGFIIAVSKSFCGMVTDKRIFINRLNLSKSIVIRHYDCGAVDSDLPKFKIYYVRQLTSKINYVTSCDTNYIDYRQWQKVDK